MCMRYLSMSEKSEFLIARILRVNLRVVAMVIAVLAYACLGSPTPDTLSWVEVFVGGVLVFAVGVAAFRHVFFSFSEGRHVGAWFVVGQMFLIVGLVSGVCGALVSDASFMAIMRDVLPFGFLFLPLFLLGLNKRLGFERIYLTAFLCLGVIFALRAGGAGVGGAFMPSFIAGGEALYYLGNSPAVLFLALFGLGCAMEVLSRGVGVRSLVVAVICLAGCAAAVLPIVMTAQRASMAAIVVYGIVVFGVLFMRYPRRMLFVGTGFGVFVAFAFGGFLLDAYEGVVSKSSLVGANMRAEEWAAVWGQISQHPLTLIFGRGWGAFFASPAVADIEVSYTHSLLSMMLLKIGVLGFGLCVLYIGALFLALLRCFRGGEVLVLALAAPLLIDVFLYAAYKSLDFGLLLGMISVVILRDSKISRIASDAPLLYENSKGVT